MILIYEKMDEICKAVHIVFHIGTALYDSRGHRRGFDAEIFVADNKSRCEQW